MTEPDLSIINMWELRGRNVNEELHTPSIRQPLPGPICVKRTVEMLGKKLGLPALISQSTPASISTILPKSSYDLATDQGEAINEMLMTVLQTFNQTILTAITGNSTGNLDSNNVPHNNVLDRQPVSILNTNNIQKTDNSTTKRLLQAKLSQPHQDLPNRKF